MLLAGSTTFDQKLQLFSLYICKSEVSKTASGISSEKYPLSSVYTQSNPFPG
jgi:hypothetical protein